MIAYVKLGGYVIVYSELWSFFSWNNSLSFNVIPFAWVSSVCVHVLVNLEKYRNFTMVIKKTKNIIIAIGNFLLKFYLHFVKNVAVVHMCVSGWSHLM